MGKLPKLKVLNPSWDVTEEVRELEQGKYLPYSGQIAIVVEGEVVRSYDELLRVASASQNRDKEFLEVRFLEIVGGG